MNLIIIFLVISSLWLGRGEGMFKIGNVGIKNNIVLAPMAGVSNPPYMKICEEMGVGYVVTELISAEAIVRNNKKTFDMFKGYEELNIPVGVQLFGSNPDVMAKAAKIVFDMNLFSVIDINMGCPVPKVAIKSKAGSALLKEPSKIYEIVKRVVEVVSIPVTVKIRIGWDDKSINAVEVAKLCEKAGASAIFVHGRTRSQGYSGKVNYDVIKEVKDNVSIPVIGNGDIVDIASAIRMFDTGVDAIMVGRGCLGNPWLIRDLVNYFDKGIIPINVSYKERIDMCFHHLSYLMKLKSEHVSVLEMRTHIAWYIKGMPDCVEIKKEIFKASSVKELENILKKYLNKLES